MVLNLNKTIQSNVGLQNKGLIRKAFGVCCLILVLSLVQLFPIGNAVLSISLILYFILVTNQPLTPFFIIPFFLAVVHLSPWSGWLLIEEFDFLILTTFAASLYLGLLNFKIMQYKKLRFVLCLLLLIYLIAFFKGFFPIQTFDTNALSTYYTNYLAFRLLRSFVWVLMLMPITLFCFNYYPEESKQSLNLGVSIGLLFVGLIVLWERGVLGDLINFTNRYQLVQNLLDFSSTHRVTALFSDMHTGGEAIDGYLVLVLPFALALIITCKKKHLYVIGALTIVLGLYSTLSTFTRATYVASFIAILTFIAGLFYIKISAPGFHKVTAKSLFGLVTPIVILFLSTLYIFALGGVFSIFGCVIAFLMSILVKTLFDRTEWYKSIPIHLIIFFLSTYIIFHGMMASKWISNEFFDSFLISGVLATLNMLASSLLFYSRRGILKTKELLGYTSIISIVFLLVTPATQGYRMQVRLSTSVNDFNSRFDHWKKVKDLVQHDWLSQAFGMGLGTYPKEYLFNIDKAGSVGTFLYKKTEFDNSLILGGGTDLGLGQRVSINPNTNYSITIKIRALEGAPRVQTLFCQKNLLYQTHANLCSGKQLKELTNEWKTITVLVNSKHIGEHSWIERWPSLFIIYNKKVGSLVEIDSISVRDFNNVEILENGDFISGGDYWYSYNDYEHLQWHIKNFWLNIYYEMGIVGSIIFACIFLYAFIENWGKFKKGSVFNLGIFSSLVGIQLQGLFGSMMDSPRIAFLLLYFLTISFIPDKNSLSGNNTQT